MFWRKKTKEVEDNNNIDVGTESLEFSINSMFRFDALLNFIMTSIVVRGLGWLLCISLAAAFGAMFIYGGYKLIQGKPGKSNENTAVVSQLENDNESATEEDIEHEKD